ncbi:AmmeMemoRadiSam system protein B [Thermodesulfobacterium sp. TA1]|uniref:AmmeMemoRadiSam system protein B n=1 Tax=Thermodesulfobacterium sp. TA1 TaxID=2234087 RepID=UPI00123245F1|nr:AmmeMemoRadiSam system protein B [Thermodesulfobacterium sp. TA1]QER42052.1 AmmeMemoRadiSam system protein B [Thermodesulfobacterium sp. TA1]
MKREPAVAGYFYSNNPKELEKHLAELIKFSETKIPAKGGVLPHAGYFYSGHVAGAVYGKIVPPDIAVILGPNHTGMGKPIAVFNGTSFITPLGEAKINKTFTTRFIELCPLASEDFLAHAHEHSLEVQVPFLQYINPKVEIVAICLRWISLKEIREIGIALAQTISLFPEKRIFIVASSDFSHYVPQETAKYKDSLAIKEILSLSEEGLLKVVVENNISMCGVIPVAINIVACKHLGATKGELIAYATSGDIIRDYSSVVGYGGIVIY